MSVSADAPSATTGAMAEEEEVEDDGKTVALAKGGLTDLARTAGRTSLAREPRAISLAREPRGISLTRIACRATQAFLLCRHHQGGTKTNIKTRGLGASRSHVLSLASWAEHRPSLSAHLQAVCSRGECSPPQA